MPMVARSATSMSINNSLWAKIPVWQGFSGRNRLNSHSNPRPPHPQAASDGFIERAPQRSVSLQSSCESAPPIKH